MGAASQHGPAHRISAPRQPAGAASAAPGGDFLLGGVSSFAFQGTNAHALLGKQLGSADGFALPGPNSSFLEAVSVQAVRLWVLPAAHPLISSSAARSAGKAGRSVVFDCHLAEPRLALYSDHVVFGRVLFPGAGMLEAALAAGMTVLEGTPGAGGSGGSVLAVSGMAIAAPLILSHPKEGQQSGGKRGQQRSGPVLRCSMDPASGDLQLTHAESPGSKRSAPIAHCCLRLAASTAAAVAVQAAAAVAVRTLAVRRLLLGRALAALAHPTPTGPDPAGGHATGSILADSRHSIDGYLVPPPCMDACLHLGVAVPGCGAKVPVAVGSFALVDRRPAAFGELAGSTSAVHAVPAGQTDTSSFALRTPAGGAFASLADLQTRVSKPKAAAGQASAATSVKAADFLYEVDWQAVEQAPEGLPSAGGRQPTASAVLAVSGTSARVDLAAGTPHSAASAALHLLQRAQAAPAPAVDAAMPDVLPDGIAAAGLARGPSQVLAAGALEGLLRVAATEQAAAAYSLAAGDSLAAAAQPGRPSGAGEPGMLQTVRARRRVRTVPRLLPR